jgi:signal transduction histidine kinase
VLRECRASAGKSDVSLIADLPQTLPCVLGDPLRIKQILVHLISNAVKFTPEGGRVSIGWRREKDGALSIVVRDNGIGMTEENIRRAMQPFEQLDSGLNRKFEGLGLGLPLANMLANYHGGTLRIASAPGHGTAVTFTLPAARIMRQRALASA